MKDIKKLLENSKTIAIVGLSPKEDRASNRVAKYLMEKGYEIIPINPGQKEILGKKAYPNLEEIPGDIQVDIVDVFRKGEDTPPIAKSAIKIEAKCLWLQLKIKNETARSLAAEANMEYVEDRCIKIEHSRLF